MWFWFGIFTSLKLAALLAHLRFQASWAGEARRARGRECEVRVTTTKDGSVSSVRVGVPCRDDFRFTVRRQNAVDNFFLRLGLAAEQTARDVVFDDSVYLLSDDRRLGQLLRRDGKMRRALHRLLYKYNDDAMRVRRVRGGHGRLWVDCYPALWLSTLDENLAIKRVIRSLYRAARGLDGVVTVESETKGPEEPTLESGAAHELGAPRQPPRSAHALDSGPAKPDELPHDRHAFTAAALLTASTALCISGGIFVIAALPSPLPIVLDSRSLVTASLLVGIACTLALLALCVALLRKTSRIHVVAMELLVTGTLGCVTTGYGVLHHVNADIEGEQPVFVDVAAWGARQYGCGKNNRDTCYEVKLGPGDKVEPRLFALDRRNYFLFKDASSARLTVYAGKLGFRWIARIDPIASTQAVK